MKQSRRVILLVGYTLILTIIGVMSLEASTDYQVTFASRYIWRGFDLNPNNKPVLQPSVTFNFGQSGFSVNWWGSFSFANKELHESDITLAYTFKTPETYSLSMGFIHYGWYFTKGFSFKDNTSHEVYLSAGLPTTFLRPNISLFYDFANGSGLYAQLGVGHTIKIAESISADWVATLGYNSKQWCDKSGLSNLCVGVTVPIKMNQVTISPFANVVFIFMDAVNPGVDNEMTLGVSLLF